MLIVQLRSLGQSSKFTSFLGKMYHVVAGYDNHLKHSYVSYAVIVCRDGGMILDSNNYNKVLISENVINMTD